MTEPAFTRRRLAALALGAPLGLGLFGRPALAAPDASLRPASLLTHPVVQTDEEHTAADTGLDRFRHVTTQVTINGQGPFTFLVDTGANRSAVSVAVAEQLGLRPGEPVRVHTVVGSRVRPTVILDELRIGGRAQHGVHAPTLEFTGVAADGVLGVDWLRNRRLTFFFEEGRLEIAGSAVRSAFADERLGGTALTVPAFMQAGQLTIVNAQVGRQAVVAMVDTGAQFTLGNLALRAVVEKQQGVGFAPERVGILTVTGERVEGDLIYVPNMRVGPLRFNRAPVVFADVGVFGLWGMERQPAIVLGLGVLGGFQAVTLDYGRRQVRFDLPSGRRSLGQRRAEGRGSATSGRGAL